MRVDVAIVGGGLVGGSLARALASCGISLALVEPRAPRPLPAEGFDLRVYALSGRSQRFFERCGLWQRVSMERVSPVHEMRIFGDDNGARLEFSAYRSRVLELAWIVEESNLQRALELSLSGQSNLAVLAGVECVGAQWADTSATLSLSDGSTIEAGLVVAADGAESKLRAAAGIGVKVHEYKQKGVVANFLAERPHRNVAHQWFREDGILALLPLPGNHVSIVWSTSEVHAEALLASGADELARAVGQACSAALGKLKPVGGAAAFRLRRLHAARLIAPRLALVGDAAHNVHPLAGQGLNLGLGDAESLAQVLASRGMENDCGAVALLRRFERSRREDILAMECVTDVLQRLFGSSLPGVAWLRNAGLRLTDRISPLKRLLVNRALG